MDVLLVTEDYVAQTMQRRFGLTVKRKGKEWHSGCPKCGGTNRFVIFPNGGLWCRECRKMGWLDDDQRNFKPDPFLAQEREREVLRRLELQRAKDEAWQNGYRVGYVDGWHAALTAVNRDWLHKKGMTDHLIDKYKLGFLPQKIVNTKRGKEAYPAYTLPIRDPETDRIVNVQYRLVDIPKDVKDVGKYRQEYGVSGREFYAMPYCLEDSQDLVLLEGMFKAIVMGDFLEMSVQVVGLPGCTPSQQIVERLKRYKRIWICLDPDAQVAAMELQRQLPGSVVMNLPAKPDDMVLSGSMTRATWREYARQARATR
jgi:hypothetical protein